MWVFSRQKMSVRVPCVHAVFRFMLIVFLVLLKFEISFNIITATQ